MSSEQQQKTLNGGNESQIDAQCHQPTEKQPDPYPYFLFLSSKHIATLLFALFVVWAFPWLYAGVSWKPLDKVRRSEIWVLNCDVVPNASSLNPALAPYLAAAFPHPVGSSWLQSSVLNRSSSISAVNHFVSFTCPNVPSNSSLPCGSAEEELACVEYIDHLMKDDQKGWGLIYFASNFTTTIMSYIYGSGISPHGQTVEMQYHYVSGRDYPAIRFGSSVLMEGVFPSISQGIMASLATLANSFAVDPLLFARGIQVMRGDQSPVRFFGQHFASFFFCVNIWLGSTFLAGLNYNFKTPAEAAYLDIKTVNKPGKKQLLKELLFKLAFSLLFLFVLAVLLVCIIWSLGRGKAPFHRNGGQAMALLWFLGWGFLGINWVLVSVMGAEKFSSIAAFILVLQLTTGNAIFHNILSTNFFKMGRMFPFYYATRGLRTIFFGVMENKWWVNWLVIAAWNVGTLLMAVPIAVHITVKKSEEMALRFAGKKVPPQLAIL